MRIFNVGRFINADKATFIKNGKVSNEYDSFSYCENTPIIHFDDLGEAKRIIFKNQNSTIFTIKQFNIESRVIEASFELRYLFHGIKVLQFSDYNTFKNKWNAMTTQNIVVVNCHAAPRTMQGIGLDKIRSLKYKNIKALILLGCNAGHYDYRTQNVAYEFSKIITGCVLASDGTVYSGTVTPFVSIADSSWKQYRNAKKSKRIINKGWLIYNKKKVSCTYLYSITILSAIDYLKRRSLIRIANM